MSYENFKPTVWSKHIQHELEKLCVMQDCCNTKWQGEVGLGKRVKIIGAARPEVKTYTPGTDIEAAETPPIRRSTSISTSTNTRISLWTISTKRRLSTG